MKKILVILFLATNILAALAEPITNNGRVTGKIIGKSNNEPVEYAMVALYRSADSTAITGVLTDSLGTFRLDNVKNGSYELRCSYVGYGECRSQRFTIDNAHRNIAIGTLVMDDSAETLGEVVVSGRRSTYIQTIDKKIFNVSTDIASVGGAASDLLQNIPSVQVDVEGNVSLRGNENVLVLIDGKPSVMMRGTNRGTVLQQISANQIERVEVITNPSAQFKPDGTSGIINIIMKKERKAGVNGSLTANVGNQSRYNAGATLGFSTKTFSITGNYGFRRDRRDRYTDNVRTLTDETTGAHTYVDQYTYSKAPSTSHLGGLGVQWNISPKDRFEASANYTCMTFPRLENNRMTQRDDNQTVRDYTRSRDDNESHKVAEGAAAFTHEFAKNKTLTVDYTYAMQDELERNRYTNTFTIPDYSVSKDNTIIKQKNYENLIRAVYESELSADSKLVAGYEAELDKSDMRYFAEDFSGGAWVKNTTKSNDFIFNENVHSLYATYEKMLGDFGFLAGVRGEQSYITSNLLTLNQRVKDNYFMFYPTLHTAYKLGENSELQLNYSLRVNRPEGDDLNPFPEYQDPYNIKSGNPYLKPEKIHSAELGWQLKRGAATFIITPYYRYTFNKMTQITHVLDDGIIQTTKENMSSSSAAGTEMIFNSTFSRLCDFNISGNLFYNRIDATDLGYSDKKGAMAWYVSLNANFTPTHNFMFQLNTRYNSSVLTPQGNKGATYILNLGARYDLPKQNIAFTATVSDLFDSYKSILNVRTPAITQRVERRRQPRTFYVGVTYKFGTDGKAKKNEGLKYEETAP